MAENRVAGRFAFLLHADVAGSTSLVQQDEHLAHQRIQATFRRFGDIIARYHGRVRELRGDALLAEFERASDAVTAALAFQADQAEHNIQVEDTIRPIVRVGIASGEVIFADHTVTGAGVVLAQRIEQLAQPGGVCVTGAIREALPQRLPYNEETLGEKRLKGFEKPVHVYRVRLNDDATLPAPSALHSARTRPITRWVAIVAAVILICGGGLLAWLQPWVPEFEPASAKAMTYPLPTEPSIAVLPFKNYSDDPESHFVASGITEDLTTSLSKVPGLFVIARTSTEAYKDQPVAIKQVAEDLGVQYVLEGSIQKGDGELRINTQLIDALSGHHLWAEHFDRPLRRVFEVQDEITKRVTVELQVELTEGERAKLAAKGTDNLRAWLLRTRGHAELMKWTRDSMIRARDLYKAAYDEDPEWALPLAGIAYTHWYEAKLGWSKSKDESIRLGQEFAERAIEIDSTDPAGYQALGNIHFLLGQPERAIELRRKAIELAPNDFSTLAGLAIRLNEFGGEQEAIRLFERAIRLSPKHPWWVSAGYGLSLHLTGRKEKAVEAYNRAIDLGSNDPRLLARLAAVYADLGRTAEARSLAEKVLRIEPDFTVSRYLLSYPIADSEQRAWYKDLLLDSGLPEHPPLNLPDEPSIAVLPFETLSAGSEQSHFADGITENLITALTNIDGMFVIARESSFTYKGKNAEARTAAGELGVRYIVKGSVQTAGDRIRISAQLIDTVADRHVWAQKYDRELKDFFKVQDEITLNIAAALQINVTEGEHARLRRATTNNLEAWNYFVRGDKTYRRYTKEDLSEAKRLWTEAAEMDPDWPMPKVGLAWIPVTEFQFGWTDEADEALERAARLAEKALAADESFPETYALLSRIHTLKGNFEKATELGQKALSMSPNNPMNMVIVASNLARAGQPEESIGLMKKAMRRSPFYPSWYTTILIRAYLLSGRYDDMILLAEEFVNRSSGIPAKETHAHLIFAYAERGQEDQARAHVTRLLEIEPDYSLSHEKETRMRQYRDGAFWERYYEVLRRMGLS